MKKNIILSDLLTTKGICSKKTYITLTAKYWGDPANGITNKNSCNTKQFCKLLDKLDIAYNVINNNARKLKQFDKIFLNNEDDVKKLYRLSNSYEHQTPVTLFDKDKVMNRLLFKLKNDLLSHDKLTALLDKDSNLFDEIIDATPLLSKELDFPFSACVQHKKMNSKEYKEENYIISNYRFKLFIFNNLATGVPTHYKVKNSYKALFLLKVFRQNKKKSDRELEEEELFKKAIFTISYMQADLMKDIEEIKGFNAAVKRINYLKDIVKEGKEHKAFLYISYKYKGIRRAPYMLEV